MQKKVIALAVAGLVSGAAFAQTSVTMSGTVDFGYNFGKDKWENGSATNYTHKYTNFRGGDGKGMSSSRLNIDVKEQLGSGLKAGYFHEIGLEHFAGDHNDAVLSANGVGSARAFTRSRQSFAYLESASAGRFQIGLSNLIIDDQTSFANVGSRNHVGHAYNASFYDPRSGASTKFIDAMDLARANTISYYSPSFSGFQVMGQAGYGKSEVEVGSTETETEYKIYNLGLKYANGPVKAFIGAQKYETDDSSSGITSNEYDRREFIVAASYDFKVAKLTGMYFDRKAETATTGTSSVDQKYRGGDIGLTVPVGQAELFANYGFGKNKFEVTNGDAWKIQTYQLGARYNLSKRTNVYALYGYGKAKEDRDNSGTGKRNVASIGLRHSF